MVISMQFNSIDMWKYILGDFKLVWGLRVHKCTQNVTFIVILTKMKHIVLFVTTNTWYDSAKHYTRFITEDISLITKNLNMVKWVKYGPLTPCLR